jgi:ribonuclease P protein component
LHPILFSNLKKKSKFELIIFHLFILRDKFLTTTLLKNNSLSIIKIEFTFHKKKKKTLNFNLINRRVVQITTMHVRMRVELETIVWH